MTEPTQRDKFCALLYDRRIERTLGREPLPRDDYAVWWNGKLKRCWRSGRLTKRAIRLRLQNRLRSTPSALNPYAENTKAQRATDEENIERFGAMFGLKTI